MCLALIAHMQKVLLLLARQTQRLLAAAQLLNNEKPDGAAQPIRLMTTGDLQGLQAAAQRWLGLPPEVCWAIPALLSNPAP
jgi:glutamate racemase